VGRGPALREVSTIPMQAPPPFRNLGLRISNVWLLDGGPGDRWLVDCGHRLERRALARALGRIGLSPRTLAGVVLTHRHSDHAGNAAWLQRLGARVFAHRADAEILSGARPRFRLRLDYGSPISRLFALLENRWPAERVTVDRAFEHGERIGGLSVHHAPGHTEGSVLLHHAQSRCLLSGDTIINALPPLARREGLCFAYQSFTIDRAQALAAVQAFHERGIEYEHLLGGHGPPLVGGARARVMRFLEEEAGRMKEAPVG
jgi:glyoxylase-like metal-dependent hydrolase (beta-lactamase superfamily II)